MFKKSQSLKFKKSQSLKYQSGEFLEKIPPPPLRKYPLVSQHFEILDRENLGDSNCSLPLEMIIFEGKSVQNTSRILKIFACGAY